MFEQLNNIDKAFKHIKLFTVVVIVASLATCCYALFKSYEMLNSAQQRIYILANGKALEAFSAERKDNVPVEARDHIKMFHYYFFSLDPDEKVINNNISQALDLADASAKSQYDDLKENNYYAGIISGNVSQRVTMDSIQVDINNYPYYFRYYGKERIIRPTVVVVRSLITEGFLRNVARSDNNPHGFLIERWKILRNSDISTQSRSSNEAIY